MPSAAKGDAKRDTHYRIEVSLPYRFPNLRHRIHQCSVVIKGWNCFGSFFSSGSMAIRSPELLPARGLEVKEGKGQEGRAFMQRQLRNSQPLVDRRKPAKRMP